MNLKHEYIHGLGWRTIADGGVQFDTQQEGHSLEVTAVTAFPSTPILDPLDFPESPLSSDGNWTTNWQFGTSQMLCTSAGGAYSPSGYGSASWTEETFGPDAHEVYVLSPTDGDSYLAACIQAGTVSNSLINGYTLNWNPTGGNGEIIIGRYVSNSVTNLDSVNVGTISSTDQLGMRVGDGVIRCFFNGTQIMAVEDDMYTSGFFGLMTNRTADTGFRDFGGGLVPAGGGIRLISSGGGLLLKEDGGGGVEIQSSGVPGATVDIGAEEAITLESGTNIILVGLPTSDPLVAGALWDSGGTVKISHG